MNRQDLHVAFIALLFLLAVLLVLRLALSSPGATWKATRASEIKTDIPKLCKAIAYAETGNCKKGVGRLYNNCHGIRAHNHFVHYKTTQDSFNACEKLWSTGYGGRFPDRKDAVVYSGNTRADTWLRLVKQKYGE